MVLTSEFIEPTHSRTFCLKIQMSYFILNKQHLLYLHALLSEYSLLIVFTSFKESVFGYFPFSTKRQYSEK